MSKREDHNVRIKTRHELWKKQNGKCAYCGKTVAPDKTSLDHVIPINRIEENYGSDNLVMTCKSCNINKLDYIVFSNLFDRIVYPIIDVPVFFRYNYIIKNFKDRKVKIREMENENDKTKTF